ncbi:MAG: putative monovalent cation/H+ antiporter subunit A [Bacteroidetes bacterium]|nr:putative monovalent cation/H+ antiporter subunit A [Bacteroidota bacterium]
MFTIPAVVLTGFVASVAAPWLWRRLPRRIATGILVFVPLALFAYFLNLAGPVSVGQSFGVSLPWVPQLGITFSFAIDGLSVLFALLITGIGALVALYASGYLQGDAHAGRFYAYIMLFMGSMLGLVLADNLILLFVFWELTSISSYFLIGYNHERQEARAAALQSLLVTGVGGLILLAGFILLGSVGGSYDVSALLQNGEAVRSSPLYLAVLLLIVIGACTKSAQFPFHFWLPAAMEAPSPVSAYLHSATMVKAGVYLLARISPILGATPEWHYLLSLVGATTMLVGAALAFGQSDLKRILAYTTVSALGMLVLMIGLDTLSSMEAAMVFLVAHALYKGALFLVAGTVDHETGTRDIRRLGGLRRLMPVTALAALLAALSMAGLPPLLGFIGKELLYEAKLQAPATAWILTAAGIGTNVLFVALAARVLTAPFLGSLKETPHKPGEPGLSMLAGPVLLGLLGLLCGLFPYALGKTLIIPAVAATRADQTTLELALWHGFNPVLALSLVTLATGFAVFLLTGSLLRATAFLGRLRSLGPARWYAIGMKALIGFASLCTDVLQNGRLGWYLLTIVLASLLLVGYPLFVLIPEGAGPALTAPAFHELLIAVVILLAALGAILASSRLAAVAALGVVGFGMALLFVFYGAPDLAMTQFAIESLTVILFVLVIHKLPKFSKLSGRGERLRDGIVAAAGGVMMCLLTLIILRQPLDSAVTPFYAANSLLLAQGRNVVNVILVDFRALDTLGEITVLAVAGLGGFALLRLRLTRKERQ